MALGDLGTGQGVCKIVDRIWDPRTPHHGGNGERLRAGLGAEASGGPGGDPLVWASGKGRRGAAVHWGGAKWTGELAGRC